MTTVATMSERERKDLTWTVWRTYERDGMQAALRLLRLVGLVYGKNEQRSMTHAVRTYRERVAAFE